MQHIDENYMYKFFSASVRLCQIFFSRYRFLKYFVFDITVFSSGNYGFIITEKGEEIDRYTAYMGSCGNFIKKDIDEDIIVKFRLEKEFIDMIIHNKDDLELNARKLFKFIPKLMRTVQIDTVNYHKDYLIGKRVILRPGTDSDIYYLLKWYNDDELNRLAGWSNAKVTASKLKYNLSKSFGYDPMNLVIENEDEKPIGTIQLYGVDEMNKSCSLGVRIGDKDYWGKGYGEDAITALLKYAFTNLDMYRVSLKVYEYNIRAYKCYLKCGFKDEGKTRKSAFIDGQFYDEIIMGILKDDFIKENE